MIEKEKTYRTRDGRKVRIYATDGHPSEPVHGAFQDYSCAWNSCMWSHDGTNIYGKVDIDLIEVKPRIKRTVWLNVFDNEVIHGGWLTKEEAQGYNPNHLVACIKVDLDFEEGEGL